MSTNLYNLVKLGSSLLKSNWFADHQLESKYIIEEILNDSLSNFLIKNKELDKKIYQKIATRFKRIIKIRCKKKIPLAYIFKRKFFFKDYFYVNKNCLIPRGDSEILIEQALEFAKNKLNQVDFLANKNINIIDICSGSGCLGISFVRHLNKDFNKLFFLDICKKTLYLAKKNSKKLLGLNNEQSLEFINSDILINKKHIKNDIKFDIIFYNPPYIRTKDLFKFDKQLKFEPKLALDGDKDGLLFYRRIEYIIQNFANKDAMLFIEIGFDQKDEIEKILQNLKQNIEFEFLKDISGNFRLLIIRLS